MGAADLGEEHPCITGLAAQVKGFHAEEYLKSQKTYLDPASAFALAGASLALQDSGIDLAREERTRVGVMLGSAYGSLSTMNLFFEDFLRKGPRFVKPFLFPHVYANTAISLLAIEYTMKGFHTMFSSGFISAASALLYGGDVIRQGRADVIVAGGVDALNATLLRGYAAMGLLAAPSGDGAGSRPFDQRRSGMVLGEGGAVLILEDWDHAASRGARVYAELAGGGMFSGGGVTREEPLYRDALARSMAAALSEAETAASAVDYISASANSSRLLDAEEGAAIESLFASTNPGVCVSSIKSMIGETMGAGGAMQAIGAVGALMTGQVPATANLTQPERDWGVRMVMGTAAQRQVRNVLVNSVDPGGSVVSLALRRTGN